MGLEEIIATAVAERADLVRIVEDASIRVFFRIDGYLGFRYHAFVDKPPAWHPGLAGDTTRTFLDVPPSLAGSVSELPLAFRSIHDARVVEIGIVLTEGEREERRVQAEAEAVRLAAEREAFAADMAFRDAESRRAPDPEKVARLDAILDGTRRQMLPLAVEEEDGRPGIGRLGGHPLWPVDRPWPVSGDGTPLTFLAQVDCRGLDGIPAMPVSGLLQFFYLPEIAYGTDSEDGLVVVHHPDAGFEAADPARLPPVDPEGEGALEDPGRARRLVALPVRASRREMDESFLNEHPDIDRNYGPERDLVWDREEDDPRPEHFIGGWPSTCQELPYEADTVVLLRLGSADGMMWSDGGDFHVLISRADLEAGAYDRAWSAFNTH